jgi:multiple sugar transport system substrate-binding protein
MEEHSMRSHLKVPALAIIAVLVLAACTTGASPSASAPGGETTAPATEAPAGESPSAAAEGPNAECDTPEEATAGAKSTDPNAMQMWERSGGNAGMVDRLVCDWNTANPDRPISLTYIPHAEMVTKIAQGIASGDVPDLMGMDLIYAPQFENAGQLVDLTDRIGSWPELDTASPGHMTVATFDERLYGVPLYADVSALFYNKDLFEQAGLDPNKPPTSLAELREYADKITALGGDIKGYYLPGNCAGCNIFTVGPLMWASGATIEAATCGDEPLVGDGVKEVLQWTRDQVKAGNVPETARAETGETFAEQFGTGKIGMMGTGNFNITLANNQMVGPPDHSFEFGISNLPGVDPGSSASFIGGDLVVVPQGSDRVDDAVDFMKFLLSDHTQVESYAQLLNLTTRSDMADNKYFQDEPLVQDVAKALEVGRTPYTLTFFEQINSPQGPWLQMLQRAYYTDDDLDTIINDAKEQMKQISCAPA